jgi:hypothetical protein
MSQGQNPWSDLGSLEALRLGGRSLVRAVQDATDDEARGELMWAATLAGIAFGNAGVHLPHAMSYAVAGLVPLPGSSIRVLERDGNILIASGIDHACLDLGPAPLLSVASSVIASPSSSSVVTRPSYLCSAGARSSCSALGTDQRRSRDTSA